MPSRETTRSSACLSQRVRAFFHASGPRLTLALTGCILSVACSGCGKSAVAPVVGPSPAFTFTSSSVSVNLVAGGASASVTLLVTGQNGFSSPVQVSLSGLPAGVTVQPGTNVTLTPGTSTQITLTASSSATPASTVATVTASSGSLLQTATLTINIAAAPPPPDFSLSLTPQTLILNQAQKGQTFQVTATAVNGFSGNISLALSNLPSGVTTSAANLSLTAGVPQTITLTAAADAQLGNGSATLTATSGTLIHTGNVALTVYLAGIQTTPFIHPGIAHSQADLDRMKTNINAGIEPYKSAFANFAASGYSSYNNTGQGPFTYETYAHGQFEIRNDAQVAHQNAIMWYITGDKRYLTNAITIMNAWATTMTAFDVTDVLTAGTCIRDFANAGEIIRSTGNGAWASADVTRFQNWMLTLPDVL